MFWKKFNENEKRISQINDALRRSFENVKKDTTGIFQWMNYLYKKSLEQEQTINQLKLELSYAPKTREEIKLIVDGYYSFDGMSIKIRELDHKLNELIRMQNTQLRMYGKTENYVPPSAPREAPREMYEGILRIEKRLELLEQKKSSIKEKIIKRLAKNSKEYVKSVILSYIKKYEEVSALQLKEILVDEQNFCSKSSFYRLLEDIEKLDDVGVIKHGKEKHFIIKKLSIKD